MSSTNVGNLIVRLLLERDKFRADVRETVADAEGGANRISKAAGAITDAATDAAQGQANVASLAARSLGMLGPVAGAAIAAGVAVGVAYHQAGKEVEGFHRNIILTGNAAGVTAGQLQDMARRMDQVVGTHSQAAATLAQMTGTAQVVRENLQKVSTAAVEMERASVQSISESVKIFADLGKDPVKASVRLNESLNYLTASTYEQIKAAADLGDKEKAASIAQNSYADAMRDRTAQVSQHLGTLEKAWKKVRDLASEAWDAMLNVGREQTSQDKLESTRKRIAELENKLAAGSGFGSTGGGAATGRPNAAAQTRMQAELSALQAQAAALEGVAYSAAEAAKQERERAENQRRFFEWDQQGDAFKQKSDKLKEERRKAEVEGQRLVNAGLISEKELRDRLADIEKKYEDKGAARSAASALQKEQNAYQGLMASIQGKVKAGEAELAQSGAVTESQRMTIQLDADIAQGKVKLTSEHEKTVRAAIEELAQVERRKVALAAAKRTDEERLEIQQDINAALLAESKAREQAWRAVSDYQAQVDQAARAVEFELGLMGQSRAARTIALEQYRIELDLKQRIAEIDRNTAFTETQREAERERLRSGAAKAIATAGQRAMLDEWQQTVDRYDDVFRSGFADMLNAGKDGWKSFTRSLATTFKTTVADQLYKAFAQPFVVKIVGNLLGLTGSMGGGVGSAAGGGVMNGIQAASNLNTLWGAGSQALFGGTAGASAASLGYANIVGMAGGDAIGALATANGMWAGVATGAQAAAQSAIAANLAIEAGAAAALPAGTAAAAAGGTAAAGGGVMSGISSAVAAIPVWGWALAAVAVLGSMLSKKQTLHSGAGAIYSADQGLQEGAGIYNLGTFGMGDVREYNKDGQALASGIATGLGSTLDGLAKSFGQKAGFEVATAFADDSSKDGAWGSLRISKDGKDLLNWDDTRTSRWAPREFADGEAGQKEYLALIAKDTRQVLLDMDLPGWADKLLVNIGEVADMEKLSAAVAQIGQAQAAFESFGEYMPTFAGLADSAKTALAEASGGISTLTGNMSTFVDLFYSDAEKLTVNTQNVTDALAALGFAMPKTEGEFRDLVQAQIALGAAGAKTVAGLLGLSGAVAAVLPSAQEAEETAAAQLAESREKALRALERSVAAEKKVLQERIDAAQEAAEKWGNIAQILHDNVRDLHGEVESTRTMLAVQGRDFIEQALATAKGAGSPPDADLLAEAISGARAGLDVANFGGDTAERDYAALVLAGQLEELEKVAGKQLSDARRTVLELEKHTSRQDQELDYWRQYLDIAGDTHDAIMSVEQAVENLRRETGQSGTTKPGSVNTVGGGSTPEAGRGVVPRASYGAEEALTSFEKFKAWYNGIRNNAEPGVFMDQGYQVPDWMRIHNGADDGTDKEQFGSYLFFKNNPQYAKDFEQIYSTGRSSYATDGSTLVRSDLSKMPAEVADYYKGNRDALLMTEGFGLDPVLAYQLYNFGPGQFGLDQKKQSFTEWLQNTKWTPDGLVANNNVVALAQLNYPNYKLPRWDTSTGNIVDLDGRMYTPDGKFIGNASQAQLDAIYGAGHAVPSAGRSALYNSQVGGGASESAYYAAIKANLDAAMASGWTAQQLADAVRDTGASLQDVATAYGISVDQVRENLRNNGATNIPGFAGGGDHLGGARWVGEFGKELEVTGPARLWNGSQLRQAMSGGSDSGRAEILLQLIVEAIEDLIKATGRAAISTGRTADALEACKDGNAFIYKLAPA